MTPPALRFREATFDDAIRIATVRIAAARALTAQYGQGPWSSESTERGVLSGFRDATIVLAELPNARGADEVVGTFRLSWRKPWALDKAYFTPVERPLYLTDMAVHPLHQRRGVGRALLVHAEEMARAFPADAVWLDAYDAEAGAGDFYARCGFHERGRKLYREAPLVYFEHLIEPLTSPNA